MGKLLTETADYDTPGSWGKASEGWPGQRGDMAYDLYVFANCVDTIPYGSYVLISERGKYGAAESYIRVHPDHVDQLFEDFKNAGRPTAYESVERRNTTGKLLSNGLRDAAPRWWDKDSASDNEVVIDCMGEDRTGQSPQVNPCPFCGGSSTYFCLIPTTAGIAYQVRCNSCSATGPLVSQCQDGPETCKQKASAFWNMTNKEQ
jgi:hypothetical protein